MNKKESTTRPAVATIRVIFVRGWGGTAHAQNILEHIRGLYEVGMAELIDYQKEEEL